MTVHGLIVQPTAVDAQAQLPSLWVRRICRSGQREGPHAGTEDASSVMGHADGVGACISCSAIKNSALRVMIRWWREWLGSECGSMATVGLVCCFE